MLHSNFNCNVILQQKSKQDLWQCTCTLHLGNIYLISFDSNEYMRDFLTNSIKMVISSDSLIVKTKY